MEEENNQNVDIHVEEEDINVEDVAVDAYNRIDALVELLIKKGIITEEEIDNMEDKLLEEFEGEEKAEGSEPTSHVHSDSCGCGPQ